METLSNLISRTMIVFLVVAIIPVLIYVFSNAIFFADFPNKFGGMASNLKMGIIFFLITFFPYLIGNLLSVYFFKTWLSSLSLKWFWGVQLFPAILFVLSIIISEISLLGAIQRSSIKVLIISLMVSKFLTAFLISSVVFMTTKFYLKKLRIFAVKVRKKGRP